MHFLGIANPKPSFDNFKIAMTNAPLLALPDFSKPISIQTDASEFGLSTILHQSSHPVVVFRKNICKRLQNSSMNVRELHPMTSAIKQWRHYHLGNKFSLRQIKNV